MILLREIRCYLLLCKIFIWEGLGTRLISVIPHLCHNLWILIVEHLCQGSDDRVQWYTIVLEIRAHVLLSAPPPPQVSAQPVPLSHNTYFKRKCPLTFLNSMDARKSRSIATLFITFEASAMAGSVQEKKCPPFGQNFKQVPRPLVEEIQNVGSPWNPLYLSSNTNHCF